MLCDKCDNILTKVFKDSELVYRCSCGTDYPVSDIDSLILDEEKKAYTLIKDGRTIWYYPSNPKVWMKCNRKSCKETIVAFETSPDMSKVYGCQCGHSWREHH